MFSTNSYTGFRVLLYGIIMLFSWNLNAQMNQGGSPLKSSSRSEVLEWVDLEEVSVKTLLLEDEWTALTGRKNQRIAKEIEVLLHPEYAGSWEENSDGTLIWRLGIRGKGAKALGIVFSRYVLEKGARIFIYDPAGDMVLGAYTSLNNKSNGSLPVSYLQGDELIIQMEIPPECENYGELQIGFVRWAYLPVFEEKSLKDGYFGSSGDCNVDINCFLGDDWQIVKNSVVRMINIEKCTGTLINNTRQDSTAYILTAAHCIFHDNKLHETTFYFNYESPTCDGGDGSIEFSIAGATLLATGDTLENPRDSDSLDFALLKLSLAPPKSYNPYFAGWNRSTTPAQHSTTIHHPGADVKKIAVDLDPPEVSYHDINYFPELIRYSHWRIRKWDTATTEPGSSGCPLFDENKLVIGSLTGGRAICENPENDYFTRFDYAWDYYSDPAKQLKHWLDPDNTGPVSLTGLGPNSISTQTFSRDLILYPNPARDRLTVVTDLPPGKETEISVYNVSGRLQIQMRLDWNGKAGIDVSGLNPGIYVFRLRQGSIMLNRQFIIGH